MNSQTTLSVSEARKQIFKIIDQIEKTGLYFTLTEKGMPKAVIMSAEEFDSWQETLAVMKEFPDIKKDIKKAEEEYRKGRYITLEELLIKEGYVISDRKRSYEISHRSAKKNRKRLSTA